MDESGSAVVESLFAIFALLLLTVGTIQMALSLYARNTVMSAVHDGVRAAVEVGAGEDDAAVTARGVIHRSAGSLIDELHVVAVTQRMGDRHRIRLTASGLLDAPGPIPIRIPVSFDASSARETLDVER